MRMQNRMQNRMHIRIGCITGCRFMCIIEFCLCRASCPQIGGPSLLGRWPRKAKLCETLNNAKAEPNAIFNAYSNRLHCRMQIHVHNRILLMQSKLSTNRRPIEAVHGGLRALLNYHMLAAAFDACKHA